MKKLHKEVDIKERLKVVISLIAKKFDGRAAIDSAIAAIDYAGKEHLRLRGSITGSGVILGNVMLLDLDIPLSTTNSRDVEARYDEFNRAVVQYLTRGKYHVTAGKTLGNFGSLNVGYVDVNPTSERIVNVKVGTDLSNDELRGVVENAGGRVIETNEQYW